MSHKDRILEIMQKVVIANIQTIAATIEALGIWQAGDSTYQNVYKCLNLLVKEGKLIKEKNYYKIPACKSNFDSHAINLTCDLASILKSYPQSIIYREHTISEVGLRPDALVLIRKINQEGGGAACAIVYECVLQERPEYLTKKENIWKTWQGALTFLTNLFNQKIPYFEFVTSENLNNFLLA